MPELNNSETKPLHEMTLEELKREYAFREGMRNRYEGGRQKLHETLRLRVEKVQAYILAVERGEKIEPEDEK